MRTIIAYSFPVFQAREKSYPHSAARSRSIRPLPHRLTERAAAIMLAAILPAKAQRVIGRFDVPPAEYDHPYSGKLVVVKVSKRDLLQFLCERLGSW